MDFDVGIEPVGLARQQRLDLALVADVLELAKRGFAFENGRLVAFHLAQFDERDRIIEIAFERLVAVDRLLERGALAHELLRFRRIAP